MSKIADRLPKWRSHKIVGAGKIVGFTGDDHPTRMVVELADGSTEEVLPAEKMFARYRPVAGDVVYDDGYASISPREAFEQGYRPLSPTTHDGKRWTPDAASDAR